MPKYAKIPLQQWRFSDLRSKMKREAPVQKNRKQPTGKDKKALKVG
jgi:hypothetical protein